MKVTNRPIQPWVVTIQLALVLCFTIWHFIRSISVLFYWETLATYNSQPYYLFATGFIWTLCGLSMIWLIWQAKQVTIQIGRWLLFIYFLYTWANRLIIQVSPSENFVFQFGIELILFLIYLIPFSLEEGQAYYIKETL